MRTFSHRAAIVMLLALVYQWGVCPCGCAEHNAWFQLSGLSDDHDHDHSPLPRETSVGAADDHQCTGAPRPLFLTKTDRMGVDVPSRMLSAAAIFDSSLQVASPGGGDFRHRGPPDLGHARANRSVLQVYRL